MARWQPDARGRLRQAAFELYGEHGFDQTTVAQIAERAGLTERTFYRHFADKREVVFSGEVQRVLVSTLADAPASMTAIEAVTAALDAAGAVLDKRRDMTRRRQAVIAANPSLQQGEQIKYAMLAADMAEALARAGRRAPVRPPGRRRRRGRLSGRVRALDRRGRAPRFRPARPGGAGPARSCDQWLDVADARARVTYSANRDRPTRSHDCAGGFGDGVEPRLQTALTRPVTDPYACQIQEAAGLRQPRSREARCIIARSMPRYLIERTFTVSIEEMPPVASRSKRIVNTEFPDITWEHSHVVVTDDGQVRTFCVYSAPDEEMVREHSKELGDHIIDVIHEIAGDVSPEDLPDE